MQNEGKRRAFVLTCETSKYGNRRAQRGQKWGQTRNCKNAPLDFRKMSDTAWLIFRVGGTSTKFHLLGEHMNLGVRFSYRNTQMMYCASQAAVGKTISIQLCRWRRTMDRPERNAKEHRCCISHIYKNEFHEQCWPHKTLSLKSVYENS